MCIPIIWAALMSIAGMAIETYRWRLHEMPKRYQVLSALVLLSHHPIGLWLQFLVYLQFYTYAPWGVSLAVTAYGIFGFYAFWYFLMGPEY